MHRLNVAYACRVAVARLRSFVQTGVLEQARALMDGGEGGQLGCGTLIL